MATFPCSEFSRLPGKVPADVTVSAADTRLITLLSAANVLSRKIHDRIWWDFDMCADHRIWLFDAATEPGGAESLKAIYEWHKLLDELFAQSMGLPQDEAVELQDRINSEQALLMEAACALPARSAQDLAYKLALWAADNPDVTSHHQTRGERVALSALADFAVAGGLPELAPSLPRAA